MNQSARARLALAHACALGGRRKKALASLKDAVERGYHDAAALEQERDFDSLRGDAEFRKILEEVRQMKVSNRDATR